ncbi:MAG: hypothetical protein AAB213_04930, partial [Candidatus Omnitrophota bacterium]
MILFSPDYVYSFKSCSIFDLMGFIKKMKKSLLPFVVFLIFLGLAPGFGKEPVKIRVAVLKDRMDATLSVTGSFEIADARTKASLYRGRNFLGM